MKRIRLPLAAALLLLLLPAFALAEGETAPPASALPAPSPPAAAGLAIDSLNVYDGMDQAYMNGYAPRVKSGKATIVLPLVATGEIEGNAVTVTPSLGDPSSAPFVFKNYQKTVKLSNNKVKGGGTVASYLVRFDLPLKSGRLNGAYPVTISIEARAADGSAIQQSYTWYVIITDGKAPNAPPPSPKPTVPVSHPKIIVSAYRLDPAPASAGRELTVTVTLRNTSEAQAVRDVKVTASCDSPDFALRNDSNTIFIDGIGKGETADIELKYKVGLKAAAQQYNIALAIEYDNAEAMTLSSAGTVAVTVAQPLRVQMEAPKIASEVNAGDTLPLSFQVMNLGRGAVYNVRVELSAPGLFPSGAAFIGNMEAGTAKTGEMDVFVGMKNMTEGHEGEKYGMTGGKITLVYEDDEGREYREETEFATTINEPVLPAAPAQPEEKPEKAGQWWISILVGGVVILGLAAVFIFRGRGRGRRHEST
jgi:hypothetical protein